MSIFDARVRVLDNKTYIKELYLANFSNQSWDRDQIGFENMLFQDNGEGFDLKANDGVFTSAKKFNFSSTFPNLENGKIFSVLDVAIVSPEFKYFDELETLKAEYKVNSLIKGNNSSQYAKGPKASISCDVKICSSGCLADYIWSGFGCVCVSNCRVEIGWE